MATFKTTRFGQLTYDEKDLIRLPEGLIGLPGLRRWLLLDMDGDLPLKWLQSVDRGDFCVPVMSPYFYTDDYDVAPGGPQRAVLGGARAADLVTLVITTVHAGGHLLTANLRAPLILNCDTRRGVQVALDDERYAIRQEIDPLKFGLAVRGDTLENDPTEAPVVAGEQPETAAAGL